MIQPGQPDPASKPASRRSVAARDRVALRRARTRRPMSLCLCDFDALYAPTVATWVRNDRELLWLAPRTPPPLSASKVMAWGRDRSSRMLLWDAASATPVGYTELNEMPGERDHLWIGHFLLAPHLRGRGLGKNFVRAVLARGFLDFNAREVSLVVFPDNHPAIRAYECGGMKAVGREFKYFKESRTRHEFVRMSIRRTAYERLIAAGEQPQRSILFIGDSALLRSGPIRLPFQSS
ncbi:MAG: GNAT family N-acetyltransferase [Phycisphaerae bacterium]|nr:GNAT family N-acetyltransferase [Phycisphaerae bacterium]